MNPFGAVPLWAIVLWVFTIVLILSDWFLRRKFSLPYLALSVKLSSTPKGNIRLVGNTKDQIQDVGTTKIYDDSKNSCVWMQCNFLNNRSTMGLIRRWNYNPLSSRVESEETRLSIGVLAVGLLSIFLFLVFFQAFEVVSRGAFPRVLPYIVMVVVPAINVWLALSRFRRESDWTLEKLTDGKVAKDSFAQQDAKDQIVYRVPFRQHVIAQILFLFVCALIQFAAKLEMILPYFLLTGIHYLGSFAFYGQRTRKAFENRFHENITMGGFDKTEVFSIFKRKKPTEGKSEEYNQMLAENRRSVYLAFTIFGSVGVGSILLMLLEAGMNNWLGLACTAFKLPHIAP